MYYRDMLIPTSLDQETLRLTKRNLVALGRCLSIPTTMFRSPILCDVGYKVYQAVSELNLQDSSDFELLLIWYLVGTEHVSKKIVARDGGYLQLMSDVCCYMAFNKLLIQCSKSVSYSDIKAFSEVDNITDSVTRFFLNYDKLNLSVQLYTEQEKEVKKKSIATDPSSDVPMELQQHLQNYKTIPKLVHEICRIQMLSPVQCRTDDTFKSLVRAWEVLSKE